MFSEDHRAKKRDGEILTVAKSPVVMVAPTAPIYDAIHLMAKKGFVGCRSLTLGRNIWKE